MKSIKAFCLIIGAGAAGLQAGISFLSNFSRNEIGIKNCIIAGPDASNSRISPWNVMECSESEAKEKIWQSGNKLSNLEVLDVFCRNHRRTLEVLEELGVPLQKSNIGKVPKMKGSEVTDIFEKKFLENGGERVRGYVKKFLVDDNNRICGAIVSEGNRSIEIIAGKIIIAAGGLSNIYQYTTGYSANNAPNILALAMEAGIDIENLEFNMFHPFLIIDKKLPKTLVSGELLQKAKYLDDAGNEFLTAEIKEALANNKHHSVFPKMTREFYAQSLKSKIYMDISGISEDYFRAYVKENEFGWVFANKKFNEIKKFEIHPAFHYSIGGIKINGKAETNQPNVYAAGEISSGLHGSNRIGGFAISEAIVFGEVAGKEAARNAEIPRAGKMKEAGDSLITPELKKMVWDNFGPIKKYEDIQKVKNKLKSKEKLSSEEKLVLAMAESSVRRGSVGTNFIE